MVSLDIIWWIIFARLTHHTSGRIIVSVFMAAIMLGLVAIIAARMSRGDWDRMIPKSAVSAIFIWHFIGLGLLTLIGVLLIPILIGQKIISRKAPAKIERAEMNHWTRRDFLGFTGAILPPVFTFGLTGI